MKREIETFGAESEKCGVLGQAEADPRLLMIAICNLIWTRLSVWRGA